MNTDLIKEKKEELKNLQKIYDKNYREFKSFPKTFVQNFFKSEFLIDAIFDEVDMLLIRFNYNKLDVKSSVALDITFEKDGISHKITANKTFLKDENFLNFLSYLSSKMEILNDNTNILKNFHDKYEELLNKKNTSICMLEKQLHDIVELETTELLNKYHSVFNPYQGNIENFIESLPSESLIPLLNTNCPEERPFAFKFFKLLKHRDHGYSTNDYLIDFLEYEVIVYNYKQKNEYYKFPKHSMVGQKVDKIDAQELIQNAISFNDKIVTDLGDFRDTQLKFLQQVGVNYFKESEFEKIFSKYLIKENLKQF